MVAKGATQLPRKKIFQFLDIPRFAAPDILNMDAATTGLRIGHERMQGHGYISYESVWSAFPKVIRGYATDDFIEQQFSYYRKSRDSWKNQELQTIVKLLREAFGGKGRWYPASKNFKEVLGVRFRPPIRGFWFYQGRSYAISANLRKKQRLTLEQMQFLARAAYEIHCVNDPNDPIPLIIDLSQASEGLQRERRLFTFEPNEMMPLEAMEAGLREFFSALAIAGVCAIPPRNIGLLDQFRSW